MGAILELRFPKFWVWKSANHFFTKFYNTIVYYFG